MQDGRVVDVRGLISLFCENGTPVRIWILRQKYGDIYQRWLNLVESLWSDNSTTSTNMIRWKMGNSPQKIDSVCRL